MYTILVIDDDPCILEIFSVFLHRKGHIVYTAPGGIEGIGLLQTIKPDLIVLDIMMMPMDGWETLKSLKGNPVSRAIPVTMFSGKMPEPDELCRFGHLIEDYLIKPLEFKQLSETLESIIGRHRAWQTEVRLLEDELQDPKQIEEYWRIRKQLYLMEKFSPYFDKGHATVEPIIRHQKECISNFERYFHAQDLVPSPSSSEGVP